mgnify:CR=1 FL=1
MSKPSKLGQVKIKEFKKPELVPSNSKILKPFNWSLIAFAIIWDSSIFNSSYPNKNELALANKIKENIVKKTSIVVF